jgi:hypothetical protein
MIMESCDRRIRAYRNGKTFEQCKEIAKSINSQIQEQILAKGKVSWKELLEKVDHDEIVYKLTLKYLRLDGFDIGDWKTPEIKKSNSD